MTRSWYSSGRKGPFEFAPYVRVADRRRRADDHVAVLRKAGKSVAPVVLEGRAIATTFWGKAWCKHLEGHSDYATRMPRGRSYVRNGSVVHLEVTKGKVAALVSGTSVYEVEVTMAPLAKPRTKSLAAACSGNVTSLFELLEGKLPKALLETMTDADRGIFPRAADIELACSCPDWARMCKHVAAVLYGIGARLDTRPELLFTLRGVDAEALVAKSVAERGAKIRKPPKRALTAVDLGDVFGIELENS